MEPVESRSNEAELLTVVVGIDFSDASGYAMSVARRLVGTAVRADLHVVLSVEALPNKRTPAWWPICAWGTQLPKSRGSRESWLPT